MRGAFFMAILLVRVWFLLNLTIKSILVFYIVYNRQINPL